MTMLEVSARLKIRPGELEGFKQQAAEMLRQAKQNDTKILRYDWFLSDDGTECEVREAYVDSAGMIEHNMHVLEAKKMMFQNFAAGHTMYVYSEPSPQLLELAARLSPAVQFHWYTFLQGLESDGGPEQVESISSSPLSEPVPAMGK
jgi:quinol monooxygenase YgiN